MERGIISCKTEATKNIPIPPILFSHLINELVCQNREWNWRGQGKGFAIKKKTEEED